MWAKSYTDAVRKAKHAEFHFPWDYRELTQNGRAQLYNVHLYEAYIWPIWATLYSFPSIQNGHFTPPSFSEGIVHNFSIIIIQSRDKKWLNTCAEVVEPITI